MSIKQQFNLSLDHDAFIQCSTWIETILQEYRTVFSWIIKAILTIVSVLQHVV